MSSSEVWHPTSRGGNRSDLIVGLLIQRYDKKMKPPNILTRKLQNNNYFLQKKMDTAITAVSILLDIMSKYNNVNYMKETINFYLPVNYITKNYSLQESICSIVITTTIQNLFQKFESCFSASDIKEIFQSDFIDGTSILASNKANTLL